ncbi:MAG: MauE/DoxX family redox-associated membrane protein [Chlorobiales bacterium]
MILMLKNLEKFLKSETISLYFCITFISIIFFIAGSGKFFDIDIFLRALRPLPFLFKFTNSEIVLFGFLLGALEIALATLIWFANFRKLVASVILFLLFLFTVFISYLLFNDIPAKCSCFSLLSERVLTPVSLFQDIVLMIFSIYIIKKSDSIYELKNEVGR